MTLNENSFDDYEWSENSFDDYEFDDYVTNCRINVQRR